MKEWATIKEIAAALGVSKRAVQKAAVKMGRQEIKNFLANAMLIV